MVLQVSVTLQAEGTNCYGQLGGAEPWGSEVIFSPYLLASSQEWDTLHQGQIVPTAHVATQEKWGSTAAQAATRHHCHPVSQQLRLIQVVGGEDQGATWVQRPNPHVLSGHRAIAQAGASARKCPPHVANSYLSLKTPSSAPPCLEPFLAPQAELRGTLSPPPTLTFPVFEQEIPNATAGSGVHTSCWLIQDNYLGAPHKGNGHRELPLHATWVGTEAGISARSSPVSDGVPLLCIPAAPPTQTSSLAPSGFPQYLPVSSGFPPPFS